MSLTRINRNMLETQLASVIAGTGTVMHDNSFIIGDVSNTTANDTLFINNLDASGGITADGAISTSTNVTAGGSLIVGSGGILSQGPATIENNLNVSGVLSADAAGLTGLASVYSVGLSGDEFDFTNNPITDQNNPIINLALKVTGVSAGNYGDASTIPSFDVNEKGLVTGVSGVSIHPTISASLGLIQSTPGIYGGLSGVPVVTVNDSGIVQDVYVVSTPNTPAGSYGSNLEQIPSISINSNGFVTDASTFSIAEAVSSVASTLALSARNDAVSILAGASGVYIATLEDGKIPSSQLPSYVDDVIEVSNFASLSASGESNKIYTTLDNNKIYRWSGSAYVEISPSPGSTDSVTEGATNLYFTASRAVAAVNNSSTGLLGTATPTSVSCSLASIASAGVDSKYARQDHTHNLTLVNANTLTGAVSSGAISVAALVERGSVSSTAPTGTIALDTLQTATLYRTSNATGNITLNITNATAFLTDNGQMISVSFIYPCGSSIFSVTTVQTDGTNRTVLWQNGSGSAPTATASATNVYTFTIIRTALNTYTILGNLSFFK